jgi:L-lactate dehydrogenase
LPVSSLINGPYGIHDVCLSVPTEVGCGGVRKQIELALTPKERLGLQNSARVLREIIGQVEARLSGGKVAPPQAAAPAAKSGERAIPRTAWNMAKK